MTVEIVPRPKAKPKRIITFLFFLSTVFLILAVAAYFGLYSIKDKKNEELEDLRISLTAQETAELRGLQKDLMEYEGKIKDIATLLDSYREPTKFFRFLGGITHPRVMWFNLTLDLLEGNVSLSGEADNVTTLIQQVYIFEGESRIGDFKLSSFSMGEGQGVSFNVAFSLAPELFK